MRHVEKKVEVIELIDKNARHEKVNFKTSSDRSRSDDRAAHSIMFEFNFVCFHRNISTRL